MLKKKKTVKIFKRNWIWVFGVVFLLLISFFGFRTRYYLEPPEVSKEEAQKKAIDFVKQVGFQDVSFENIKVTDEGDYWMVWFEKTVDVLPHVHTIKVYKTTGEVEYQPQK